VEARKAVVQPIISNRDIQKVLNAKGLAYPSGHCPQVKLSGYLLGGGMAWNQGVWGSGTESIEAIELVTAEGRLITASKDEHAEYFWAARGSGYGFFGVVTRYHLKLHPLPKAIHGSTYY
jgi:FAD/FMN-containing dehydrogenase